MATKVDYPSLERVYRHFWDTMQIRTSWNSAMSRRANAILRNKARYLKIQERTGVPWYWIGCVHSMEAGLSFRGHLHNGDSLRRRTYHVPRGRPVSGEGPFTWEESAADALLMKRLDRIKVWSVERCLFEFERYNGWGYRRYHPSTLSPYLFSGTNHYRRGKYIADGRWSSRAVSGQTGAAGLLKKLKELDSSVAFGAVTLPVKKPAPTLADRTPILPPEVVVAKSRKLTVVKHCKNFAKFTGASIAGVFTVDNLGIAQGWIVHVKEFATTNSIWIALAGIALVWLVSSYITKTAVEDQEAGRYVPSGAA